MDRVTTLSGNTTLELIWTFLAILGVLFTLQQLLECVKDLRILCSSPTFLHGGARHIVARQNIRNIAIRAGILAGFVLIGVISLSTPTLVKNPPVTIHGLLFAAAFIGAEFCLVAASIYDRQDRDSIYFAIRVRRYEPARASNE